MEKNIIDKIVCKINVDDDLSSIIYPNEDKIYSFVVYSQLINDELSGWKIVYLVSQMIIIILWI